MKNKTEKTKIEKNFFGDGYTEYDSHGHKVGSMEKDLLGNGYTHYDAKGHKIGRSEINFFGDGYTDYDNNGHKIGSSEKDIIGNGYTHYDANGHKVGRSQPHFFDEGYTNYGSSNGGMGIGPANNFEYNNQDFYTTNNASQHRSSNKTPGVNSNVGQDINKKMMLGIIELGLMSLAFTGFITIIIFPNLVSFLYLSICSGMVYLLEKYVRK